MAENTTVAVKRKLRQISDLCFNASEEIYEDEEMESLGILDMCDKLQDAIDKYLKIYDYKEE